MGRAVYFVAGGEEVNFANGRQSRRAHSATHILAVPSAPPAARRLPSSLNATLTTALAPLRVRSSWPFFASHTLNVLSSPPLKMRLPSELNVALHTPAVWPLRARMTWPVSASHTLTILSRQPV